MGAYADEILYEARLYPFKKVTRLTAHELVSLHRAVYSVPTKAVGVLRARVGDKIHRKVRDFLKVHAKRTTPAPGAATRSLPSPQIDVKLTTVVTVSPDLY